jgi:hypothetical protein
VVPLTEEERAQLRATRAAQVEDGGAWLEAAMGGGGGLEGLMESLAAGSDGEGAEAGTAATQAAC